MKGTKVKKVLSQSRGITLVALIITIVVLLILAVVAIRSIQDDGLISKAEGVADKYNQAQTKEEGVLDYYADILDYHQLLSEGKAWQQNGTEVVIGGGTEEVTKVEIGDYVNYDSGTEYNDVNGWRVLGSENGKLLLVSTRLVVEDGNFAFTDVERGGRNEEYKVESTPENDAKAAKAYLNAVNILNEKCAPFGKGEYAVGARSINAEDINKITGYNPETAGFKKGEEGEYGNTIKYTMTADKKFVQIETSNGITGVADGTKNGNLSEADTACTIFKLLDGRRLETGAAQEVTERSTSYRYYVHDFIADKESTAYKMLVTDIEVDDYDEMWGQKVNHGGRYWLATPYTYTRIGRVCYGVMMMFGAKDSNGVYSIGQVSGSPLFETNIGITGSGSVLQYGIRAVVKISPEAKLTPAGEHSWTLSK